jgi:hypothetical protein
MLELEASILLNIECRKDSTQTMKTSSPKHPLNTHRNIYFMSVTLETSQLPISWLNLVAELH